METITHRIGGICLIKSGKRLPAGYDFSVEPTKYRYIRSRDIKAGKITLDDVAYIDEETKRRINKYIINAGDVAITIVANIGDIGYATPDCDGINLTENAVRLTAFNQTIVSSKFLSYYLAQPSMKVYMENLAAGAAQAKLGIYKIEKMKVQLPVLSVQNAIVEIIEKYDYLIELNNKRLKALEQMAENLYKEWFVRFRFPGHESAEFENGIPKNWNIRRLREYGRIETGKTPSTEVLDNYGEEIMFVKTPDMHGNSFVIHTEEYLSWIGHQTQPKKLLPRKSIMVTCIGSGGIVALNAEQAHTNQQINSIIPDNPIYLEWLFYSCKNLKGTIEMYGATGTTMTNLSKGKFERLKVIEPNEELVASFHRIVKPILRRIEQLSHLNINLTKQRDLLRPRLMSGKLEV